MADSLAQSLPKGSVMERKIRNIQGNKGTLKLKGTKNLRTIKQGGGEFRWLTKNVVKKEVTDGITTKILIDCQRGYVVQLLHKLQKLQKYSVHPKHGEFLKIKKREGRKIKRVLITSSEENTVRCRRYVRLVPGQKEQCPLQQCIHGHLHWCGSNVMGVTKNFYWNCSALAHSVWSYLNLLIKSNKLQGCGIASVT